MIPPEALENRKAREVVRAWITPDDALHVALASGAWDDPGAWGVLLVDLAQHVANAYSQAAGLDRRDVLQRIRQVFDAEWAAPGGDPTGGLVGDQG